MKIAIIIGSVRLKRQSIKVGNYLSGLINEMDIDNTMLDLKDYPFPVMEERFRFLDKPADWMIDFQKKLDEADGIILLTPEYNGSYSGALKNALDYYKSEYVKKAIGVVTVSSGEWGGINASHHLLSWALHVKAIPSPSKLMVKDVEEAFDSKGLPQNERLVKQSKSFLNEFLWLTEAISSKR